LSSRFILVQLDSCKLRHFNTIQIQFHAIAGKKKKQITEPSKLVYRHAALTNGEKEKRFELLLTPSLATSIGLIGLNEIESMAQSFKRKFTFCRQWV